MDEGAEGLDHRTATRLSKSATTSSTSNVIASEAAIVDDPESENSNTHKAVFGEQLESALAEGDVLPKNVIRLLNLGLADGSIKNLDPRSRTMLLEVRNEQDHILSRCLPRKVNMYFPHAKKPLEIELGSIRDVLMAFFVYLLDLAKNSVEKSNGLGQREQVEIMFKRAKVAVSW